MRIIAGEKRSRRLKAPEGMDTRPTGDKVKEALFSMLLSRLPGARVLDLYSGSGALSLEALSRGADSAVMVDISPKACRIIDENIQSLDYQDRARLLRMGDMAAIALLKKQGDAFDLIFLDPPYRINAAPVCEKLAQEGLLKPEGLIVVEHAKETPPDVGAPLVLRDRRQYGIAGLSFYEWMGEGEA